MTNYVVGFAFDKAKQVVALIEKKRPSWQAGKLNGIGGHVENGETFAFAQTREFYEEAGIWIPTEEWKHFAVLQGPGYLVRCYRAFYDRVFTVETKSDEAVHLLPVDKWQLVPHIDNLSYLIPLALDEEHVGVPRFHYGAQATTKKVVEPVQQNVVA